MPVLVVSRAPPQVIFKRDTGKTLVGCLGWGGGVGVTVGLSEILSAVLLRRDEQP